MENNTKVLEKIHELQNLVNELVEEVLKMKKRLNELTLLNTIIVRDHQRTEDDE